MNHLVTSQSNSRRAVTVIGTAKKNRPNSYPNGNTGLPHLPSIALLTNFYIPFDDIRGTLIVWHWFDSLVHKYTEVLPVMDSVREKALQDYRKKLLETRKRRD